MSNPFATVAGEEEEGNDYGNNSAELGLWKSTRPSKHADSTTQEVSLFTFWTYIAPFLWGV